MSSFTEGPAVNGTRYVTVPLARSTLLETVSTDGGSVFLMDTLPGRWGTWLVTTSGQLGGISGDGRVLVLGRVGQTSTVGGTQLLVSRRRRAGGTSSTCPARSRSTRLPGRQTRCT